MKGKPLTLEQLREMEGQPVWGVSLISGKPGEWFIVRIVEMSKTWFIACAGASQGFGDKDNYGKAWIAYDQPPATINREAWEPCKFCGKYTIFSYRAFLKKEDAIKTLHGETVQQACGFCQYCPVCGHPLTEEAWAELEKRLGV